MCDESAAGFCWEKYHDDHVSHDDHDNNYDHNDDDDDNDEHDGSESIYHLCSMAWFEPYCSSIYSFMFYKRHDEDGLSLFADSIFFDFSKSNQTFYLHTCPYAIKVSML